MHELITSGCAGRSQNLEIMAKNIGLIQISGKVGNLQFRKRKGVNIVGNTTDLTKERIMKDPAFVRTRENMAEFGGSASISKAIRLGLLPLKSLIDKGLHNRFTALIRSVLEEGTGTRGMRNVQFSLNKELLEGFEFNERTLFYEVCQVPMLISSNAERNAIQVVVGAFSNEYLMIPDGATHFRIHAGAYSISDFAVGGVKKKYGAVVGAQNGLLGTVVTDIIALDAAGYAGFELNAVLDGAPVLDPNVCLTALVGIEFLQEKKEGMYLLASNNALTIKKVF